MSPFERKKLYVYRQDGYTFDTGPSIITAPYLLAELWTLCGRKMSDDIDLRPIDPFYEIRFDDGETFACTADLPAMRAEVGTHPGAGVPGVISSAPVLDEIVPDPVKMGPVPLRQPA